MIIPTPTITSTPTQTPIPPSPTPRGFVIVDISHKGGSLEDQLQLEARKAQALSLKPLAEFFATWCPPCQSITACLRQENPLMVDAFDGTYITVSPPGAGVRMAAGGMITFPRI